MFHPSKVLTNHSPGSLITSLDFSDNGHWALSTGNDESLQLYDCRTGSHSKSVLSKQFGCTLARFTHRSKNCIYASVKDDDSLRYVSLHDDQFIRYFKGHKNVVNSLEMSPVDDTFISSAWDRTVKLWDLRTPNCTGTIAVPTPSLVAFDSMAMIFAVASQAAKSVALYDVRNFQNAPFKTFSAHFVEGAWQKVEFSNDSKLIVVASDGEYHGLFDALDGSMRGLATGHQIVKRQTPSTSPVAFTPDSKYLVGGGLDRVCYWDTAKMAEGDESSVFKPSHLTPTMGNAALIAFNPRTQLMASADRAMQFWIPQ